MKKFLSMVMAAAALVSCMSVTAFARIDTARVYPLSEAPAMERTQKIGGVTFSNVVKCEEVDGVDYNGETIHIYKLLQGVGTSSRACMQSTSDHVEFYYYPDEMNQKYKGRFDSEAVTGKLNYDAYMETVDLAFFDVLPYAGEKNADGDWVGGLVWEFVMDDAHTRNGEYSRIHMLKAVVDGQPYHYMIQLTNRPDYANGTIFPPLGAVLTNPDGTLAQPAESAVANPNPSKVYVNGREVAFEAYNINNNNYFKLRDIALALRGTEKQFEVVWDPNIKSIIGEKLYNGAIVMTSKTPYTAVGGEMKAGDGKAKQAVLSRSPILMNNSGVPITAYTINENNFFKLRDLGNIFDFNVSWDARLNAVVINTAESYDPAT